MPAVLHLNPPRGCVVRVLSDLHLAHKRGRAPDVPALAESMRGVDMLILAGDTAETREACAERELSMQRREQLRRECRQRGIQLVELAGNHDPDIEAQLALLWNGSVAVMHGHSLIPCVSPWSREYLACADEVKRMIAASPAAERDLAARLALTRDISLLLGRHVPPPQRERRRGLLREAHHCFWPPQRPLSIVTAWLTCGRRAHAFCDRFLPGVQLLVIGHFHRSGQWSNGTRRVLNTGAWFEHATPFAADLCDGRLIRYGPHRA